jgi:predicted esterase
MNRVMKLAARWVVALLIATSAHHAKSNFAFGVAPREAEDPELADVSSEDRRIGDNAKQRYFLIGAKEKKEPTEGYSLLIVLPGGGASAEFNPFIRRLFKYTLDENWLVAQAVAPRWNKQQAEQLVWPTEKHPHKSAKFSTEDFLQAIIDDVQVKAKINPKRIYLLGWSSGGPPCYAMALRKDSPVNGAFVAMSIFAPNSLPPLENGQDKRFYLLQSPDDRVTKFFFAEKASQALKTAGAEVHLERYAGGHGWNGPVWQMIGNGINWLVKSESESSDAASP